MLSIVKCLTLASLVGLSAQQSCAALYAQCGGQGWTGATCCVANSVCSVLNPYYSQCVPATSTTANGGHGPSTTTKVGGSSTTKIGGSSSTKPTTSITGGGGSQTSIAGASTYTTTDTSTIASHAQSAYPSVSSDTCGAWTLVDNVCCPSYCAGDDTSLSCTGGCTCTTPPSADCKSGSMWGEVLSLADDPTWHYSRSTHFGLTDAGACGFGLYGLCTSASDAWIQTDVAGTCSAFCKSYPTLCQDPTNTTLRGNFAAPNGDYYSQFWPNLAGPLDNYLSCGECYELIMTKTDGTDYAPGDAGYTPPITLEIVDSCPCNANPDWCCGSGADHCGQIDGWTYGCPLPADSHHMDLSDIAMGRLQGNGSLNQGVIPIRYQRITCPKPGNAYIWLRDSGGPYYFALSAVNTAGLGSVTMIEIMTSDSGGWVQLEHDPNYTSSRPQERYGSWTIPNGSGPFNPPIGLRLTSPNGEQIVNTAAITSFTPPADVDPDWWYIDLGVQFTNV